ncbi:hypothetical protein KBD87_01135 [Candidatus Saccharibacteria bacterium]|nr:hypothetical protein [Candidatus Saccharibacteria bacterium]
MDLEPEARALEKNREIEAMRLANLVLKGFDIADKLQTSACEPQGRAVSLTVERNVLDTVRGDNISPQLADILCDPYVYLSIAYKRQTVDARPSLAIEFMRDDSESLEQIGELARLGGDLPEDGPFTGFDGTTAANDISCLLTELIRPKNAIVVNLEGVTDLEKESPTEITDPQSPGQALEIEDILKEKGCPYTQIEEYVFDDINGCRYIIRVESECVDDNSRITSITILKDDRILDIVDGEPVQSGTLNGAIIECSPLEHSINFIEEDSFGATKPAKEDAMAIAELMRQLSDIQDALS